jgi:hypothetical protein
MAAENDVKGLIKNYIDNGLPRRQFLSTLTSIGLTASAAGTLAKDLTPFVTRKDETKPMCRIC